MLLCACAAVFDAAVAAPALPSPWLAQLGPRSDELEKAQQQIDAGDFELAVKTLQEGLSQPELTDDQLVEMYRLLGLAQLYLGNENRAREAYEKLLQARPDFELPRSAPPKIRALYARIREDIRSRRVRPVTIAEVQLPEPTPDRPLEVEATIEDLALGAKARLYYRRTGAQAYNSVDFARQRGAKDLFRATIPAYDLPPEERPYDMQYYVEVADLAQRRLAGRGDAFNPLTFRVQPRRSAGAPIETAATLQNESAWYKNPLIWLGIGAVAAGATAGVYFAVTSRPTGTLPITIRAEASP